MTPNWLPNWHPTSGFDRTLDVVGSNVDSRCYRMPVMTEHHPGVHMTEEIRQQLRGYTGGREDRGGGVPKIVRSDNPVDAGGDGDPFD